MVRIFNEDKFSNMVTIFASCFSQNVLSLISGIFLTGTQLLMQSVRLTQRLVLDKSFQEQGCLRWNTLYRNWNPL